MGNTLEFGLLIGCSKNNMGILENKNTKAMWEEGFILAHSPRDTVCYSGES